ncbi:MAG: hypothetical protein GX129_09875 [Clostridiales bacterium]|nr:hypothetical protein [Clostridiales bacterium]
MIELVIALMISAIIILMIMFFLNNASRGFRLTNDEVNLQMEAQTILNQLSNLAMEALDMEALKMEDYPSLQGEKRFIFKYKEDEYYTIILNDSYLYQVFTDNLEEARLPSIYSKEQNLLAEYVEDLIIKPFNKSVTIDLTLSLGTDKERLRKKVKFRNER